MNVVFVIKALSNPGGGAERVLANLASGLAGRGHCVTVVTSDTTGTQPFYQLDNAVRKVFLGVGRVAGRSTPWDVLRRILLLRREISELAPDVVVAFMHSSYLLVGVALQGTGIPIVASEHIGLEHYRTRKLQKLLLFSAPFLVKEITVVSEQIRDSFPLCLKRSMVVAPNIVAVPKDVEKAVKKSSDKERILLSVGRLAQQKDHSCLVSAFSRVTADFPDWRLRIVGEGELRRDLETQIRDLGLDKRVDLPGAIRDISHEYQNADLFVLPSLYESLGLATIEALMHHVPVVGFADCPGTNLLVRNNVNGVLVDGTAGRVESLAKTLRALMSSPEQLNRLGSASTQELENMLGLEGALDKWEAIISNVAQNANLDSWRA